MSYLERNLLALGVYDPELAERVKSADGPSGIRVLRSKSGAPIPKVGRTFLHSGYYPDKESERFASEILAKKIRTAAIFGFGFGYHLQSLHKTGVDVIVIEPSIEMLRAAFESHDLTSVIQSVSIITPDKYEDATREIDHSKSIWIRHEPSVRLSQKAHDSLWDVFRARVKAATKKYRIMVIGPTFGGTTTIAQSVVRAITALGFDVDFVDNTIHQDEYFRINNITPNTAHQDALKNLYSNFLGESIVARADHTRPDIIIALAQAPLRPEMITRLKKLGPPVVFWFVEDYRTISYWRSVAPCYDYFFCIQKGDFFDLLAEAGARRPGYLPVAADHFVHRPLVLDSQEMEKYGSDLSFMGAGYPNRRSFFAGLLEYPLVIWGTEWNLDSLVGHRVKNANRRLDPEEYVKIFNATSININLHSSVTHHGVDPIGDFVNPRTFEIAACGGFELVDTRTHLPEVFDIGRQIVTFSDIDDLRDKLDHYMKHPEQRARIAEAGRRRVLGEHTFVHRMARMINIVSELEEGRIESNRSRGDSINRIDSMIERTDNAELAEFLGKFRGDGALSLARVMESIEKGEGALTRPEQIFVMLDQVLTGGRSGSK